MLHISVCQDCKNQEYRVDAECCDGRTALVGTGNEFPHRGKVHSVHNPNRVLSMEYNDAALQLPFQLPQRFHERDLKGLGGECAEGKLLKVNDFASLESPIGDL